MAFDVWAPGRVNLIGEHTDYTGGLALPMAVQLGIRANGSARTDPTVVARSDQTDGEVNFDLDDATYPPSAPRWGRLLHGVARELVEAGRTIAGIDCSFTSTLPPDSGLSSSAAFSISCALAFDRTLQPREVAEIARSAELRATGVPCGIMDQLASAAGRAGHALYLDCRDVTYRHIPVPRAWSFLVVHSGQTRTLETSDYARRVEECADAERSIGPLRDANVSDTARIADPVSRSRARHVIEENTRVASFVEAMGRDDVSRSRRAPRASHRSLRDNYAVSTKPLDQLVEVLEAQPGVHGARLMGAGFGGCVIALCEHHAGETPPGLAAWRVVPSGGARRTELDDDPTANRAAGSSGVRIPRG